MHEPLGRRKLAEARGGDVGVETEASSMLVTPFERMQGRAYTEISVCGNRVTFVTINGVAHMAKLLGSVN